MQSKTLMTLLLVGATACQTMAGNDTIDPSLERADLAPLFDCQTLDSGLYWVGLDNDMEIHVPGVTNAYYEPDAPTVIFVHGWQNGVTERGERESLRYRFRDNNDDIDIDTADAWVESGWNVGVFYWTQFADEREVKDAEAKIWSSSGRRGMRWRLCDGSYTETVMPAGGAGELFYDAYTAAMSDYRGNDVRIVGHSLGNQMAVRLAHQVKTAIDAGTLPSNLLPNRVALLDPFWSKGSKDYLGGQWTGAVIRDLVGDLLDDGVVFEHYKNSNINDFAIGDRNDSLSDRIGETELIPGWISRFNQAARHTVSTYLYFHGFAHAPPAGCRTVDGEYRCDLPGPSAATSDAELRELMDGAFRFIQSEGQNTNRLDDDVLRER